MGLREVSWISYLLPTTQTVRELLENPVQPINDMSYFGCLDSVMENSKVNAAGSPGGTRLEMVPTRCCPSAQRTPSDPPDILCSSGAG